MNPMNLKASSRALAIPEILGIIFSSIDAEDANSVDIKGYRRPGTLFQCSFVNTLWRAEATRILLSNTQSYGKTLNEVFASLAETKRQSLAGYVKTGIMKISYGNGLWQAKNLGTMAFANLRAVVIGIESWQPDGGTVADYFHMPSMPQLEMLEIYSLATLDEEMLKKVMRLIVMLGPKLRHIDFSLNIQMPPRQLGELAEQLPYMETISCLGILGGSGEGDTNTTGIKIEVCSTIKRCSDFVNLYNNADTFERIQDDVDWSSIDKVPSVQDVMVCYHQQVCFPCVCAFAYFACSLSLSVL
ncbi:unnamed protein product [Penicillium salamii]|uniref:F-box domain-containing protein n=1 Tax=Penicillium salamii TaxID=1612424 RepID=A0A9W4NNH7_9EURO|nr:unnamed protein product [Penicillium salamii]CAG8187604.1 unnamed protein product [Penicillium salamii]CAG8199655.1 unnamed protein product [Penicillium salamii]CAG8205466.1 unnamed protein product [Penicillium salamii]CAG8233963.1 unnamed protein product [Penicillium salamii]